MTVPAVRTDVTASESPHHVRSSEPYLPGSEGRAVIGVSGPIAAGKTTVCRYLEHKGFSYARFSAVIDEMLSQAGLPIDRPHQQAMGEQVNRSPGQRWLCQELMKRIPEDAGEVVIDGLRFPEDHLFLVERFWHSLSTFARLGSTRYSEDTLHSCRRHRRRFPGCRESVNGVTARSDGGLGARDRRKRSQSGSLMETS
jgi:hypothetical protein